MAVVYYHAKNNGVRVTGTHNGGDNSALALIDTTKNFVTSGVAVGAQVRNTTQGGHGTVTSITTTTNTNDTLNFASMSAGDWDNGDTYTIGNDGLTWAKALDIIGLEYVLEGAGTYGYTAMTDTDVMYVESGSANGETGAYTLGAAIDASGNDGSGTGPMTIIGVKYGTTNEGVNVVYTDWRALGSADRPLFVCAAYGIALGDYYKVFNCRFTGTTANVVITGTYAAIYNCDFKQNSSSANRNGLAVSNYGAVVSCQSSGGPDYFTGAGFSIGASGKAIFCRADDLNTGYIAASAGATFLFCIAEDCATAGITIAANAGTLVMNMSFNDCAVGVNATTSIGSVFINNILEDCTADGFKWTTETPATFYCDNNLHGNADDWDLNGNNPTHPHDDFMAPAVDPEFTADENLSLASTSDCIDAGLALTLGVG